MVKYDTPDYAASRLVGTVVMYKDCPVHVENIRSSGLACVQDVRTGYDFEVDMSELDTTPVQLGYVNVGKSCVYVCRSPKRQDWKQGMRYENISAVSNMSKVPFNRITYKDISNTILNKFPKLPTCYKNVSTGKYNKQAFCRDFCLSFVVDDTGIPQVHLEYGGFGVVGSYDGERFSLNEKYQYLKERLEDYDGK